MAERKAFEPKGVWLTYPGGLDTDDVGLLEEFAKAGGTGVILELSVTRVRAEVMNLSDHLRQQGLQVGGVVPIDWLVRGGAPDIFTGGDENQAAVVDATGELLEAVAWTFQSCDAIFFSLQSGPPIEQNAKKVANEAEFNGEALHAAMDRLGRSHPGLLGARPRLIIASSQPPEWIVVAAGWILQAGRTLEVEGLMVDGSTADLPPDPQVVYEHVNIVTKRLEEMWPPTFFSLPSILPDQAAERSVLEIAGALREEDVDALVLGAAQLLQYPSLLGVISALRAYPNEIRDIDEIEHQKDDAARSKATLKATARLEATGHAQGTAHIVRETQVSAAILSDKPLDCSGIAGPDRLGYGAYAAALFQLISHEDTTLPLSMAVSAPWGSGKTSIMRWIECELNYHRAKKSHRCTVLPDVNTRGDEPGIDFDRVPEDLSRRAKTIWVDAWKYEDNASLWAALTKEIYNQGQQQLHEPLAKLKFRLALANQVKPLQAGYPWLLVLKAFLGRRIKGIMVAAVSAVGFVAFASAPSVGIDLSQLGTEVRAWISSAFATIAATVTGAGIAFAKGVFRQPFSFNLDKATAATSRRPEPVDAIAAAEDIEHMVSLLAPTSNDALVVFIDDLDRCSPDRVKDAVEAINLLFNGSPNSRTVFVLGMDVDMVAASLRVAYKRMVNELANRDSPAAQDFGFRFMGKIVQLSFNIPEPAPQALSGYLDGLIGASNVPPATGANEDARQSPVSEVAQRPLTPERAQAVRQEVSSKVQVLQTMLERLEAAEEEVEEAPAEERDAVAEVALEVARSENLKQLGADSPEVQQAIRTGAKFLPGRPRDYKRFINAVRLQLLVTNQSLKRDPDQRRATSDQIAKWTALGMRWPGLAEEIRKRGGLLADLETWAKGGSKLQRGWPKRIELLMQDPQFEKVLAADPQLGTVELHGLLSVH